MAVIKAAIATIAWKTKVAISNGVGSLFFILYHTIGYKLSIFIKRKYFKNIKYGFNIFGV